MTPERWQRINQLYRGALEREPDARAAYLADACGGDRALRQEVEGLLAGEPTLQPETEPVATVRQLLEPDARVGPYEILAPLGAGGMGEVWKARDTRLGRTVAIKFSKGGINERFQREARSIAALNHPHICTLYDIGPDYLVMEYIDGKPLHKLIPSGGLPLLEAINYAAQIADGLAAAHAAGLVHRDLKPGNIMLAADGRIKVVDFGLALVLASRHPSPDDPTLTETAAGVIVGSVSYMSPEQAMDKSVDARSDIFAFGAVLYEMLTGVRAFPGQSKVSTLADIIHKDPRPANEIVRLLPAEVESLLNRCLRKDPAHRWQNMADLKVALLDLKAQLEKRPESSPGKLLFGAAVAVVAILAIVAGINIQHDRAREAPGPAPAAVAVSPAARRLAILPFEVPANDTPTRTVADGLTEVIASSLADFQRLPGAPIAISPGDLRSRHVATAAEARRVFGADLTISGIAQPSGGKVRFNVDLLDTATSRQVAHCVFLYDAGSPLTSRDQAVRQIAAMLSLDATANARMTANAGDTSAPSAYSAYLQGRGFLARHDLPGNIDRAIASFRSATTQDPKYALAYSGLGEAYWWKANSTSDKKWTALADQSAQRAVELDTSLANAHTVLGTVYLDEGRQVDAIRELQRAIDLAPDNAEAPRKLAGIYTHMGRFKEAEALYLASTRSRPTDWYGYLLLGIFYYERERYAEAESALNQAKTLTPDNDMVRADLGGIYRMHGRYSEAIAEYQQALRIRPDSSTFAGLGGAYFYQHKFQEAVTAVETAIDLKSDDYRYWGNLGIYCRWAPGNEAKSVPALQRAIELASKRAETVKSDYAVHANLAEYRARLGDARGAFAEIERIPPAARGPFTTRLAIVYELTGHRDQALEVIRANLKTPESLNQIKDDPDLAALWKKYR